MQLAHGSPRGAKQSRRPVLWQSVLAYFDDMELEGSVEQLRQHAARGDLDAAGELAGYLEDHGSTVEALALYQHCLQEGDTSA